MKRRDWLLDSASAADKDQRAAKRSRNAGEEQLFEHGKRIQGSIDDRLGHSCHRRGSVERSFLEADQQLDWSGPQKKIPSRSRLETGLRRQRNERGPGESLNVVIEIVVVGPQALEGRHR